MKVLNVTEINQVSGAGAFNEFIVGITRVSATFSYTLKTACGTLKDPKETLDHYVTQRTEQANTFGTGVEKFFNTIFG